MAGQAPKLTTRNDVLTNLNLVLCIFLSSMMMLMILHLLRLDTYIIFIFRGFPQKQKAKKIFCHFSLFLTYVQTTQNNHLLVLFRRLVWGIERRGHYEEDMVVFAQEEREEGNTVKNDTVTKAETFYTGFKIPTQATHFQSLVNIQIGFKIDMISS